MKTGDVFDVTNSDLQTMIKRRARRIRILHGNVPLIEIEIAPPTHESSIAAPVALVTAGVRMVDGETVDVAAIVILTLIITAITMEAEVTGPDDLGVMDRLITTNIDLAENLTELLVGVAAIMEDTLIGIFHLEVMTIRTAFSMKMLSADYRKDCLYFLLRRNHSVTTWTSLTIQPHPPGT